MKTTRTFIALIAIAVTSIVVAQGPGGRPGMGGMGGGRGKPGDRQKKMLDELNLTAAQKKKADLLVKDFVAKMQKLRPPAPAGGAGMGGGRRQRPSPEMMAKFKAAREDFEKKLSKILTPAQNKKVEQMRKEAEARRAAMRGRGGPGGFGGGAPGGPAGGGH